MDARKIPGLILLITLSFSFTGCFDVDSRFRNVRNHLLSGFGNSYEKEQEFALGDISLSVVRKLASISDNDNESLEIIKNISQLQVGIYRSKTLAEGPDREQFEKICKEMERGGFKRVVRSFRNNELSAVFIKVSRKQVLYRMFIISMNRKKLVLSDLSGDLEKLFEIAVKEKGLRIGSINN